MSILTKYVLQKYLKSFFIVLISLQLFFVGIDFFQNVKNLPDSANLQLLYLFYNSFFTLTLTLPLSLVFGWILTLVILIKGNELVAFTALGVSKRKIYSPVLKVTFFLLIVIIALQATPLAYSYEQKDKILDGEYFTSTKSDIFLKYDNYYVYFQRLFPIEKRAENIHIFNVENKDLVESIVAKKAYFQNNRWYIIDAKITTKPKKIDFPTSKIVVKHEKFLHTLEGFKPKILDNVYEEKSAFSILDAVSALLLLKQQGINTDKIRGALYYEIIVSFFIIPIMMLVFAYSALNSRFFNVGKFTSLSIFFTLIIWGLFFLLHKFSNNGTLSPELSLLLPMFLWYTISFIVYKRKTSY
ncbi:permease [Malaciobacter molluscorum LMG 25693]|uniref:Permease n=1 Tax=Malaciobacter molluscorum LMG 25693 TaxID=870501 RepID=A0A2G1DFZ5_9BACT|nr:LptF/LptG family permease [Malaciobacter molluscorum]AXX91742.1 lipooligosaccharide transport system, ABC transporter permease component LptG [Malaciobacter molluscorum LMG 25693]PHO17370.1 permease [Malaciobacter molluscorum LMG 25693]RXJ92798.1 permease [Malaciobacter molluscorum]